MQHLKLTLAYDGTGLVGWQRQASGTSVQGLLEEAFAALDGAPVVVSGAGRTDAGVHALGQVASVSLTRAVAVRSVLKAINVRLPAAVRIVDVQEVDPDFHARFRATAKRYRYQVWNGPVVSPFEYPYVWHVPGPPLDVEAMHAAAARLEGTHDFASFQGAGGAVETSVRTVWSSVVAARELQPGSRLFTYEVRGDGFLRHMVRAIAGTLVEVGRGRRAAGSLDQVLGARARGAAGRTAPPGGLFLVAVEYGAGDL